MNARLAALYGITTTAKTTLERAMVPQPRLGLLSQASILTQTDPNLGTCFVEHLAAYLLEQDLHLTRGNTCQLRSVVERPNLGAMTIGQLIVDIGA